VGKYIPCVARKCLVHSTCVMASSVATNSASVELLVFSFCVHDVEYVAPFPRVKIMLLWLPGTDVLCRNCSPTSSGQALVLVSCLLYHIYTALP